MKYTYSLMVVMLTATASVGMVSAQHMHENAVAVDLNSEHQMSNAGIVHGCMMQGQMMNHGMMEESTKEKSSHTQMTKMTPRGMQRSVEASSSEEDGQTAFWKVIRCVMDDASDDPFLSASINLFTLPVVKTDPELSDEQIANLISMQQRVLADYESTSRLIVQNQDAIKALESVGESSRTDIEELTHETDTFRERRQEMVMEASRNMADVMTADQIESFEAFSVEDIHQFMMTDMSNEEMMLMMRIIHCDLMSTDMMDGGGMEMMHGEGMEMKHGGGMEMMKNCPMRAKMDHIKLKDGSDTGDRL